MSEPTPERTPLDETTESLRQRIAWLRDLWYQRPGLSEQADALDAALDEFADEADTTASEHHTPPGDATCPTRWAALGVAHACRWISHEGGVHKCVCGDLGGHKPAAPATAEAELDTLSVNRMLRRPYRLVSVGGTFNKFHRGHQEYLELALCLADKLHLFLAGDDYAKARKSYRPRSLAARRRELESFAQHINCADRVDIEPLFDPSDIEKYAQTCEDLDLVLVETQYYDWFSAWNDGRKENGLNGFDILCKTRTVLNGLELSSSLWAHEASKSSAEMENPWPAPAGGRSTRSADGREPA